MLICFRLNNGYSLKGNGFIQSYFLDLESIAATLLNLVNKKMVIVTEREKLVEAITDPEKVWDIIVVGGGATGLGIREMESWGERGREREIGLGVLS